MELSSLGTTALHQSILSGRRSIMKWLVEEVKVEVDIGDRFGRTGWMMACLNSDLVTMDYLYAQKVDVNKQTRMGESALSKVLNQGNLVLAQELVRVYRCSPYLQNAEGFSCLDIVKSVYGVFEYNLWIQNLTNSHQCSFLSFQNLKSSFCSGQALSRNMLMKLKSYLNESTNNDQIKTANFSPDFQSLINALKEFKFLIPNTEKSNPSMLA